MRKKKEEKVVVFYWEDGKEMWAIKGKRIKNVEISVYQLDESEE